MIRLRLYLRPDGIISFKVLWLHMRAMVLDRLKSPLRLEERPTPAPRAGEILVRVLACAVCRTDLHVVDGDLPDPKLPIIPGHEIVGTIEALGPGVTQFRSGERIGLQLLRLGSREPLRPPELHRLHARRRVCEPRCGRGRIRLSPARRHERR
jgi:hypothetical protein